MSQIQKLISGDVAKMWHHYKRHAVDLSGNGNHGTHTSTSFTGQGVQVHASGSVSVDDAPALQGTTGTLIVATTRPISSLLANQRIMTKRDAGGQMWTFYWSGSLISLFDGTADSALSVSIAGASYLAVDFSNGAVPNYWIDGASVGSGGAVNTITADDAPVLIGNIFNNVTNFRTPISDAMYCNRILTAPEHTALRAEFLALRRQSDSRPYEISGGTKFVQRNGIYESVATVGAGSIVENSPWQNGTATTKVVHEVVNGRLRSVFECVTAGKLSIKTSKFRQTAGQAAHGDFVIWANKAGEGNVLQLQFVASGPTGGAGYDITINADESIEVNETGVESKFATAAAEVANGTWHKYGINITDPAGVFTTQIDDVDAVASTGTNPFTDTTTAVSTHVVADLDVGDKFFLEEKAA